MLNPVRTWRQRLVLLPTGYYTCASTRCGYAFYYRGRGHWTGPYTHEGPARYARSMTSRQLRDYHGDCAAGLRHVSDQGLLEFHRIVAEHREPLRKRGDAGR